MNERISMKHGAGGRAMRALVEDLFVRGAPDLDSVSSEGGVGLSAMDDGAAIPIGDGRFLVITTDSHVISPIFFPGGDIGRLAVSGTVNDLAMMGATTVLALTCAIVIEEGFSREELERVQASVRATCEEASAPIVTGDTKVMGRGEIDGIVLSTTGVAITTRVVRDAGLRPGDRIVVTGTIGDHGLSVLASRHALLFDGRLQSDVAPIASLIGDVLAAHEDTITAMKDPTRGGVASALSEMARKSGVGVVLEQAALPVTAEVRSAAELLGIDPLIVANEGKALLGVRPERADRVVATLRRHPLGQNAAIIGTCTADHAGSLVLDTGFGRRLLAEPEGEPLPRIC
jgi:hydrogenase expression/formation protein HypE